VNTIGYSVGVEDVEPNHWVAYVLALPGCFSAARTKDQALSGVSSAVKNWFDWSQHHSGLNDEIMGGFPADSYAVGSIEAFRSHPSREDSNYLVNAFFEDDARPLTVSEIQDNSELLIYTRQDLTEAVMDIDPDLFNQPIPGDARFGTINGILKHIAVTEWWYCDRLGLVEDWSALPDEPFEALEVARANTFFRLPDLADDDRVVELMGERWSGRKLLRRALWHERDHTEHIRKILTAIR
jgi:predicted RNase H-like HicB family nuclease